MDAYPKVMYSKTAYRVVQTEDEEKQLGSGWYDHPAKVDGVAADENGFVPSPQYQDVSNLNEAPPALGEGNTYYDRVVWQAQHLGIKVDKRWSTETLLRKIAEFQPMSKDAIDEVNKLVPDDQELDYDPTLTPAAREKQDAVDKAVAEVKGDPVPKAKKAA